MDFLGQLTFQSVLSFTAIVTTISLFFCGFPICLNIYRRKTTKEISSFPFIMGFLGGTFWLRYGMLIGDFAMITVNVVSVSLMLFYLVFYAYYTTPKMSILVLIGLDFFLIGLMAVLVELFKEDARDPLGFISMIFNALNFGAPLAGLAVVVRNRNCDTLPLPMCTGNLLVSFQWLLYGVVIKDKYLIIPNSAGVTLALIQMSLFLIFPRAPGKIAPLGYCCPIFRRLEKQDEKPIKNGLPNNEQSGKWNSCAKVGDISAIPSPMSVIVPLDNGKTTASFDQTQAFP